MHADQHIEVFERAAELRRAGVAFALATVTYSQRPTSARPGAKAVVTHDGAIFGWVGGACSQPSVVRHAREALASGEPRTIRLSPDGGGNAGREGVLELAMTCHSGGTLEIFIEPFLPEPALVVVGDTPVAHALLQLGRPLGFHTVALAAGDAAADEQHPDLAFPTLSHDRMTYVVIASMGVVDEDGLRGALTLPRLPAYVGMVGSRRRFASIREFLASEGVPEERLHAVHAPAGLDIHAETPAEIALSILAQIVELRRTTSHSLPVADTPGIPAPRIVIDPICGMEVDLDTTRYTLERDGETYGFCCPACLRLFQQELTGATGA
jgi:xanthine dehydrogenase accessory factor